MCYQNAISTVHRRTYGNLYLIRSQGKQTQFKANVNPGKLVAAKAFGGRRVRRNRHRCALAGFSYQTAGHTGPRHGGSAGQRVQYPANRDGSSYRAPCASRSPDMLGTKKAALRIQAKGRFINNRSKNNQHATKLLY